MQLLRHLPRAGRNAAVVAAVGGFAVLSAAAPGMASPARSGPQTLTPINTWS